MKQIVQNYSTGKLNLTELPAPRCSSNNVLVKNRASLISVGTERYMLDLAKKSLVGKAIARPDLVRQVIHKAQTEGPMETWRQAKGRLDNPVPLGYTAAGVVIGVGEGVDGIVEGDRVSCAGSGIASHAEVLRVPTTLAVKIPDNVGFEAAAFVALGGIAMHGVRMAKLTFGERVVVLGLGLLGQLAVQIIDAAGCRVMGLDVVGSKVEMALNHGAASGAVIKQDDVVSAVREFTEGRGVDAVLIFAGTKSNEPIEMAAEIAREQGRIVVPGLVGLDIPRKTFYEKELDFVVSRAWGPGMYDPEYEAGKTDYPFPFVRWTAGRNMTHFLEMLSHERVTVDHLISHRFPMDRAVEAYEMIIAGKKTVLGVLLQYSDEPDLSRAVYLEPYPEPSASVSTASRLTAHASDLGIRIGLIGAGLFAKGTLLPALKGLSGATLHAVATSTGVSGEHIARKFHMAYCTTEADRVLKDPDIDLVMILTRHNTHASLVCQALQAGKHVFVEKPLCLTGEDLGQIVELINGQKSGSGQIVVSSNGNEPNQLLNQSTIQPILMVGFNRRFAPTTRFAVERLSRVGRPLMVHIRVNVGYIAPEVWVHDPEEGGGNIIGEVCHFVDLLQALTGASPVETSAVSARSNSQALIPEDNVVITIRMEDGSIGNIIYTTLGHKAYQRERVEIFGGGAVCVIDNFKTASWSQGRRRRKQGTFFTGVDRGYKNELETLIESISGKIPFPVPFESYVATSRTTFAIMESLKTGKPTPVDLSSKA